MMMLTSLRAAGSRPVVPPRPSGYRVGAVTDHGGRPHEFVELFVVTSWDEHLREHTDRLTGTDAEYLDYARSLSDPEPRTSHLIATELTG
jgi:hypothetical protein